MPRRAVLPCLGLLLAVVPLVPATGTLHAAKPLLFLAIAFAGGALLLVEALRRRSAPALGTPSDLAFCGWLLAALLASPGAVNAGLARVELGKLAGLLLVYLLALKGIRSPRDVRRLFGTVLASALVISLLGLQGHSRLLEARAPEEARAAFLATPFFAHSYLAAQYVVLPLVGGLVLLLERGTPRRSRLVLGLLLLPLATFLFLVGSRGAWLAVGLALLTSALLRARATAAPRGLPGLLMSVLARGLTWGLLAAALLFGAYLTGALDPSGGSRVLERLLQAFDPQASTHTFSRLRVWTHTLQMAGDHVLWGVGPGSFATAFPSYFPSERTIPHAHNQFLQVLAETGVVGLLAFLFLLRAAREAMRRGAAYLADDPERRPLFHAAAAALVAGLVYCLFETPLLWLEAGALLVALLAIVSRAGCASRDAPARPAWGLGGALLVAGVVVAALPPALASVRGTRQEQRAWEEQQAARAAFDDGASEIALERGEAALELLARADALFPWSDDFAAAASRQAYELGAFDEALTWRRIADRRRPATHQHLAALGDLLLRLGRPAEAITPLRAALWAHGTTGAQPTYALLAHAYLQAERFEEAWLIWTDLVLLWAWHEVDPGLLLDAASTILVLRRQPDFARILLDMYAARTPEAVEDPEVAALQDRLARQRTRPPRKIRRVSGPEERAVFPAALLAPAGG